MKINYLKILVLVTSATAAFVAGGQSIPLNGRQNFNASGVNHLVIGNVSGIIEINASPAKDISVQWEGKITPERHAKQNSTDFKIRTYLSNDTLWVYLETPCGDFKPKFNYRKKYNSWDHCELDAEMEINYSIQIPQHLKVFASNMNEGDIVLNGLKNSATLNHLNGNIRVTNHHGPVNLHTLNGDIDCSFASTNAEECTFNTLNGTIKLQVPPSFSAQVKFKSLHGDLYTNIAETQIKYETETEQKKGEYGGLNMKIGSNQIIKFGQGGGKWTAETLNGDVYVKTSGK